MKVVTFNVNSLRARAERFVLWLESRQPDVVCLQETKSKDDQFPQDLFSDRGYTVAFHGQPTYNGVAMAVREGLSMDDVMKGLPGDPDDDQARLIAATVEGLRIINVYVPNGGEVDGPRYPYKLRWLDRLRELLDQEADPSDDLVICGDFNIAIDDRDIWDADRFRDQILCSDKERAALRNLMDFGLSDLHRKFTEEVVFTWWDYRALGFPKNKGWRIDLFLGTESAAERCSAVLVDREERKGKKPSDHAPVMANFENKVSSTA